MRICDPFRQAGMWFMVGERHFEVRCGCGVVHRADALATRVSGDVTLYDCPSCGTSLIGVALDDRAPAPGVQSITPPVDDDGHRMCGFVFGSAVDMTLWPPGAAEEFLEIPARPGFFSARGCG